MASPESELALDILEQGLAEFDGKIEEKVFPHIVIGDFVDIKAIEDKGLQENIYGILDARGGLDDGIIGSKTTSLVTTDVNVTMDKSALASWAKSTQWTIEELAQANRLGISLDTTKMDVMLLNAHQTIQKNGFIGHKVEGLTGLLNSNKVEVEKSVVANKPVKDMTPEEALQFFTELFIAGFERTGGQMMPSDIAIDAFDLTYLTSKAAGYRNDDGRFISLKAVMEDQLSVMAGHAVNIRSIPNKYAQGIADPKKNRAVIYTRDPSILEYPVMMPETIAPEKFNLIAFQAGMYCRFGSVDIKDPSMIAYVDYPNSAK